MAGVYGKGLLERIGRQQKGTAGIPTSRSGKTQHKRP